MIQIMRNKILSRGAIIAALVALAFEKDVGPMGGENPILDWNEVTLYSQCPGTTYVFNDDGSVDTYPEDEDASYESLIHDCGFTEEEAREEIDNPPHYDSVLDLMDGDDGWFMYFKEDHPKIFTAIQQLLPNKKSKKRRS